MTVAAKSRSSKIEIDVGRCKGCGLCAEACPKNLIEKSDELSMFGYRVYSFHGEEECTGCKFCALMCPDVAITVYR